MQATTACLFDRQTALYCHMCPANLPSPRKETKKKAKRNKKVHHSVLGSLVVCNMPMDMPGSRLPRPVLPYKIAITPAASAQPHASLFAPPPSPPC